MISLVRSESSVGRGALALRRLILAGDVRPGRPLREVALAAELGVSRNTLREVLLVLASEGLVLVAVLREQESAVEDRL